MTERHFALLRCTAIWGLQPLALFVDRKSLEAQGRCHEPRRVQVLPQRVIPLSSLAVDAIIDWLTGYDSRALHGSLDAQKALAAIFREAPAINSARRQINGTICGV